MRWARKMLFAAILSICALSSKKISIYNEEMIVARCFIGFIIFSRKSLGNTFKATLDGRIQAIQEESQQFPNPNEVVPPESNEQQRLLRISLRICGTVVESLPMARYAPKCEKTVQALLCRNQNVKSATLPNATSSRRIRLKDSLVTIKLRSERRLKVCIPFLLLIPPLLFFYILCLKLGELSFFLFVLSKGAGLVGGKALSFILTKMGCSSTLASVIGSAFRALVTTEARPSLAHCMLPGSSQQPAAGEEVPQDALRDHPVATRSAPPGDIEVKQPLMGDHEREMELQDRLNRHFIGTEVDRMRYNDLIDKQVLIEKRIEMALLNDLYTRERILANRYDIRECLFYKNGAPLKESTLDLYLKEIQNDLRGSVPFRKIENEIRNYNLFLK